MQECKQKVTDAVSIVIKALSALVGRLSLSVGLENCPERGLNTISFNTSRPVI